MSDIKITKERIDALLGEADIRTLTLFGKCTVVTAKLKNGFVLTADSACVDPANYDKRTGERICLEHIANKLWELEGYRLQWEVFNKANRKGTAPGMDDEALDEMRTLCSRALRAWGAEMQSVVAAEELSELQKELCKSVRGEDNADAIAEEIADVQIMLEQMLLLHDCRDDVDEWRRRKLERLEQRLPKVPDRSQCNHAWVLERTDGSTRYYQIDIIGKNHDTYASGGKAPLTFQLHDCYADTKAMNSSNTNSGGWTSCAMRSTHLPAILALMPTEVRSGIREVNKLTSAGSQSSTINTTADKLFLLSEVEIFGSTSHSAAGEGTQYDYYKAGNSKVKNRNGSAASWWERSPYASYSTRFCLVNGNGGANYITASDARCVAFGFCF